MNRKKVVLLFPCVLALILLTGWLQLVRLDAAAPLIPDATFTVNSTTDATDANPGDGVCETALGNGVCTVRAAVQEANSTTNIDTIIIPAGVYTITLPGYDFDAAMGDFDLTQGVIISGAGATQTILDANQLDRIFEVRVFNSMPVTITGVTVQNGISPDPGGGILISADTSVTLRDLIVQNNQARYGGGITNWGQTLLEDSQVLGNIAFDDGFGAGIASYIPTVQHNVSMIIRNTTIRGNQSVNEYGFAGGIFNAGSGSYTATMFIENSVIDHNSASYRGGAIAGVGVLSIVNSTISHNDASGVFGGEGGAFEVSGGSLTISQTTIVSNTAPGIGGFHFTGGMVHIYSSIVAHNSNSNCDTALNSLGYNLESADDCGFASMGDQINTNPLLGALQDNGGATWTHALPATSPAIDAAENLNCPDFDQRGNPRPIDGNGDNNPVCDIGAFEFSAGVPFIAITDASLVEGDIDTIVTPAVFTITLSMTSTQTVTVTYTTVDGTAQAGSDYYFATATIQFAPGQITRTVPVYVPGDTEVEPDETFFVVLSNPTNGVLGDGTGLGTIINDDFIIPDVSVGDRALLEGNSGTAAATFSVTLAVASNQTVTMTYTTLDGTAQSGIDYISSSGLVVFTPGQTSQLITVLINGDTEIESDETFTVELTNVINGTIVDGSGLGTILNDDVEASGSIVFLPLMLKP